MYKSTRMVVHLKQEDRKMPNWCDNTMAVIGPREQLEKLNAHIIRSEEKAEKEGHRGWALYNIFADLGYSDDDLNRLDYRRGYLTSEPTIDENGRLFLSFDTAWGPMLEAWDDLLSKHFAGLRQVTIAEEGGNDVYVNTDDTGEIFPAHYYLDAYDDDRGIYIEDGYFETEKEAIDAFNKAFGKSFSSAREIEEYGLKLENGYCAIHEFCA